MEIQSRGQVHIGEFSCFDVRNANAFSALSIFKSQNFQNVQSNNIRFESNLSITLNIDELIK